MSDISGHVDPVRDVCVWVKEHWSAMVDAARSQGWGGDAAEDIAQKAALTALEIARLNPERLMAVTRRRRWLRGITWNKGLHAHAKRRTRERLLRENLADVRRELHPEPEPDGYGEAMPKDYWSICETVLSRRQAEVIRLILTGDMTDAEVGLSLKISEGTARWHRNEATKALRRVFREMGA